MTANPFASTGSDQVELASRTSRRDWLRMSTAMIAASGLPLMRPAQAQGSDKTKVPICVFAKPLQELSFDDMATLLAKWNVAGIEATVRRGGQVEPERVASDLPKLYDTLAKVDRQYIIMASDINSVQSPHAEKVLETASKLGIRHFRLAYYMLDLNKPVIPQIEAHAKTARELATMCGELKVQGLYQNHAGSNFVGAPVWDLLYLLKDIPREQIGIALDIRHTTVECPGTWQSAYSAVRDHVASIFVKDAVLTQDSVHDVPLGQGSRAKQLFDRIQSDGIPGPISLHMEHIDHTKHELLPQRIEATARDIATLESWMTK
jgi:sugar phosphate isomerase/epimerase